MKFLVASIAAASLTCAPLEFDENLSLQPLEGNYAVLQEFCDKGVYTTKISPFYIEHSIVDVEHQELHISDITYYSVSNGSETIEFAVRTTSQTADGSYATAIILEIDAHLFALHEFPGSIGPAGKAYVYVVVEHEYPHTLKSLYDSPDFANRTDPLLLIPCHTEPLS